MAARQRRGKSQTAQDTVPPSGSRVSRRRRRKSANTAPNRKKTSGVAPQGARSEAGRDAAPTWIDALCREHSSSSRRYLVVELEGSRRVLIAFATRELAEIYAEDEARWGTRCKVVDLDFEASSRERTG